MTIKIDTNNIFPRPANDPFPAQFAVKEMDPNFNDFVRPYVDRLEPRTLTDPLSYNQQIVPGGVYVSDGNKVLIWASQALTGQEKNLSNAWFTGTLKSDGTLTVVQMPYKSKRSSHVDFFGGTEIEPQHSSSTTLTLKTLTPQKDEVLNRFSPIGAERAAEILERTEFVPLNQDRKPVFLGKLENGEQVYVDELKNRITTRENGPPSYPTMRLFVGTPENGMRQYRVVSQTDSSVAIKVGPTSYTLSFGNSSPKIEIHQTHQLEYYPSSNPLEVTPIRLNDDALKVAQQAVANLFT